MSAPSETHSPSVTCPVAEQRATREAPGRSPTEGDSLSRPSTRDTPPTPLLFPSPHPPWSEADVSHTHHHFHHHHCPVASCLPCPQLLPAPPGFSVPSQLHLCMHCSASFPRPSQLLQHQLSRHSGQPSGFLCPHCGRTFSSHSNLRVHLHVHTGARPYACPECGRRFSQSGALKIHRRLHTGERPYTCGFCGKGFPHLAGFRAHQRTHTGEKPYSCTHCGKRFSQSGALKVHTRTHTGERPFVCGICDKGFSNRSGISFHYRSVHGLFLEPSSGAGPGRPPTGLAPEPRPPAAQREGGGVKLPYTCEDCGLGFKDAPSRNKHQAAVHYPPEAGLEKAE